MNITKYNLKKLGIAITATLMLASCGTTISIPDGAVIARQKLTQLKNDRNLSGFAPIEIQAAEQAVVAAEQPDRDSERTAHLVLIADRKVDIATMWAQSRYYEEQRIELSKASEQARLDARTREADRAREEAQIAQRNADRAMSQAALARDSAASAQSAAAAARNQTDMARKEAAVARGQADAAQLDANAARMESQSLARQIGELNARETERGLVVTLGDVLFSTGQYVIVGANDTHLERLAVFLNEYDDRTVVIEGHTDNIGSDGSNMTLSKNRADAVRNYLIGEGVASQRVSAIGRGEDSPISSNDTDTGRQQNRRVEVIIANSVVAQALN